MSLKNILYSCGVTYEIVSNIPKVQIHCFLFIFFFLNASSTQIDTCVCEQASEEPEERETLALMAARGESEETLDGETYIEKYTRGVLEVDNILCLERLRQVRQISLTSCWFYAAGVFSVCLCVRSGRDGEGSSLC